MSTVSTQLNWGTSYLVNDVYRRFLRPRATERQLVAVSRVLTIAVMAMSAGITFVLEDVRRAWEIALESGAGIGLVLILRWYWWRVNAISEIAALVASAIGFIGITLLTEIVFPVTLLYLVPWTTALLAGRDLAFPSRTHGPPGPFLYPCTSQWPWLVAGRGPGRARPARPLAGAHIA